MFIGRREELGVLQASLESPPSEMDVLHGRRRIGKSTLLEQFVRDSPAFSYSAGRIPLALSWDTGGSSRQFTVEAEFVDAPPARRAVAVVDPESCLDYRPKNSVEANVLQRANLHRELFAEHIRCPVVFWLMLVATGLFAGEAPDLWHWRIATFDFTDAPSESIKPSRLTRADSFEEFHGLPSGRQHEGLAALQDRLLQLEHFADGRPLSPREEAQRAGLLVALGKAHAAMGHREAALRATNEAVEIRRWIAAQRPDAFLPDLAASLNNLGNRLSDLACREEALQATAEAVEICRPLAEQRPDAFVPDLAMSLNNLGLDLCNSGRREESLQATAEAVRLLLPLVERYPQAFLGDVRTYLQNLRQRLADLGLDPDADPLVREAAGLLTRFDSGGTG